MQEVAGIIIVVIALFAGLALLGWAYGDFQAPQPPSAQEPPPTPPSSAT